MAFILSPWVLIAFVIFDKENRNFTFVFTVKWFGFWGCYSFWGCYWKKRMRFCIKNEVLSSLAAFFISMIDYTTPFYCKFFFENDLFDFTSNEKRRVNCKHQSNYTFCKSLQLFSRNKNKFLLLPLF